MPTITVRTARRGLVLAQWSILAMAVALLVDTMFFGPRLEPPEWNESPSVDTQGAALASDAPTLQELAPIWTRPLRQQLIEPEPAKVEKKPPPPPPAPPRLPKLQATFVEAGQSWALFLDAKGRPRVRKVHSKIDEFSVVSIETDSATLAHGGREYEVRVPQRKSFHRKRRGRS